MKESVEEEFYVLTPAACVMSILEDYGFEAPPIKICEHMYEDLMKLLESAGHVKKCVEDR